MIYILRPIFKSIWMILMGLYVLICTIFQVALYIILLILFIRLPTRRVFEFTAGYDQLMVPGTEYYIYSNGYQWLLNYWTDDPTCAVIHPDTKPFVELTIEEIFKT